MRRNIPLQHSLALLMATAATAAAAGEGLRVTDTEQAWPRWHARVGVIGPTTRADLSLASLPRAQGAQVLGDYYFAGTGFDASRLAGGFRATSGLLLGSRSAALSATAMPSAGGLSFTRSTLDASGDASAGTVPYLGVGYTGLSVRGGWGFTADLGLMALGGGLRVSRALSPSVDDVARELRLMPVLQLGVSYSF
ncbi:hypothetical protein MW290_28210 [Aquincola tertiaricarbonis]|uniref:Outer membrane protein beta-barrel domain-containing protein n=1 Tax=Aquincola tertiaricarbonis TaxID=391953 RepID=A0ABY4S7X0_AQUTE|nr:hypothetical protein [Aquincola tertiaricarbonis]URI09451.1 hypothetical protein MW290_28210 [Aquincola tertiaricarbonis]